MTTTMLYQYDSKTGEILHQRPAQTRPNGDAIIDVLGATSEAPPTDIPAKSVARWTGEEWEIVEDHRQTMDEQGRMVEGTGTKYWLPSEGDDFRSEGRYTKELGPLPTGAVLERPEKPQSAIDAEQVLAIKSALDEIDRKSSRPLRAVSAGMASTDDLAALKALEIRAQDLRYELSTLPKSAKEASNAR